MAQIYWRERKRRSAMGLLDRYGEGNAKDSKKKDKKAKKHKRKKVC